MDENATQLVERCERLLIEAKAKQLAGDVAEAQRLFNEAHRAAQEIARSGSSAVFIPGTLDALATWEPPVARHRP